MPHRLSTKVLRTPDDIPDSLLSTFNIQNVTTVASSLSRANNDGEKSAPRKSHPVALVRLMAPIEPAPLSKSTLYAPFALTGAALPRTSPAGAFALKTKSAISLEQPTPTVDTRRTSAANSTRSLKKSAPVDDQFDSSPEVTPRQSLPPYAKHELCVPDHQKPPRVHEDVGKTTKDNHSANNEVVREIIMPAFHHPSLGHKAASVADLRKIFDRPGPSNVSTHSMPMPKISPEKQYEDTVFGRPVVQRNILRYETTRSPMFPELTRTNHHSSSSEEAHTVPPKQADSPPTEGHPIQKDKLDSIPKSRLRAFLHAKKSSGSWRRLSSHLQRRSSREQSSSTGDATCHDPVSAGAKAQEATRDPPAQFFISENYHPMAAGLNKRGGGQHFGKSAPLAPLTMADNTFNGPRKSWVWGHTHGVKEQPGAVFQTSEAAASLEGNKLFRRVSKDGHFRSWSWGRRRASKGPLSNVGNNYVDATASTRGTQSSSTDNFIGHFDKPEPSDADVTADSTTDTTTVTTDTPIVDAEASCELLHPRPVRVDDIQRLVTLCKKRERSPSLSYLFQA